MKYIISLRILGAMLKNLSKPQLACQHNGRGNNKTAILSSSYEDS